MSCVFCNVVAGDLSAEVVYEDDDFMAFLDHRPVQKGHILMVPKQHFSTLLDLPSDLHQLFMANAQRLAAAVVDGLDAQGSFVAINNVVSQSVPHVHVHVVPRTKGDGLRGFFWPRTKYAEGEAEAYATRLREALEDELADRGLVARGDLVARSAALAARPAGHDHGHDHDHDHDEHGHGHGHG